MNGAYATEMIDSGSVSGQVKSKTLLFTPFNWYSHLSCLTFRNKKGPCEASTVCGRQVGRWQFDSKIARFLRCLVAKAAWWIKCNWIYNEFFFTAAFSGYSWVTVRGKMQHILWIDARLQVFETFQCLDFGFIIWMRSVWARIILFCSCVLVLFFFLIFFVLAYVNHVEFNGVIYLIKFWWKYCSMFTALARFTAGIFPGWSPREHIHFEILGLETYKSSKMSCPRPKTHYFLIWMAQDHDLFFLVWNFTKNLRFLLEDFCFLRTPEISMKICNFFATFLFFLRTLARCIL